MDVSRPYYTYLYRRRQWRQWRQHDFLSSCLFCFSPKLKNTWCFMIEIIFSDKAHYCDSSKLLNTFIQQFFTKLTGDGAEHHPPGVGHIRTPSGGIGLNPTKQIRSPMQSIFWKIAYVRIKSIFFRIQKYKSIPFVGKIWDASKKYSWETVPSIRQDISPLFIFNNWRMGLGHVKSDLHLKLVDLMVTRQVILY